MGEGSQLKGYAMHVSFGRLMGAVLLGAVALQVWGVIWWMGLSGALEPVKNLPAGVETAVVDAMLAEDVEEGAYFIPAMPAGDDEAAEAAWMDKQKAGPLGLFLYHPDGVTPLDPKFFVRGFVINVAACLLVCCVMLPGVYAGWGFVRRVAAVVSFGVVAAVVSYVNLWNWMHAPTDFSLLMSLDLLGGWLLAGIAMGLVLVAKPHGVAVPAG